MSHHAFHQALIENFPNGIIALYSQDLRYQVINGEGLKAIGLRPEDLQGQRLRDVFPPEVYERDEPTLRATLNGERTESWLAYGDEHFRVLTIPVRDEAGAVIYGMLMTQNVTRAVQTQRALQLANDKLNLAVTAARIGIWHWNRASGETRWNEHMYAIYDLTPERVAADINVWHDRLHPDDQEIALAHCDRLVKRGEASEARYRVVHGDGDVRHIYATGAVQHDDDGEYVGCIGVHLDVTDMRLMEEQLATSEARYKHLFETAFDALLVTNTAGTIVDCNLAAAILTGRERDALLGASIDQLLEVGADASALLERLERDGELVGDVTIARSDGEARFAELRARADVQAGFHQYTLRDTTEHKQIQAERARLNERLRHAERLEALGVLSGGVAHDLNNLLQVIIGQTELALSSQDLAETRADLSDVMDAAERAQRLVAQLLDFGQKRQSPQEVFDLSAVVPEMLAVIQPLLGESIALQLTMAPETYVLADQAGIEQIVMNLCLNARDAMPSGGTLRVDGLLHHADGGAQVQLSVSDTGIGIPSDALGRVFDPFFTTKAVGDGTGLGLATVYGIVKRQGGVVSVSSEFGEGTTFCVSWPWHAPPTKRPEAPPEALHHDPRRLILLAEDNAMIRDALMRSLTQQGHTVTGAAHGKEALHLLEEHGARLGLLILDVHMPHLSGPEVYAHAIKRWPSLPVIFISGHATAPDLPEPSDTVQFLRKPFKQQELLRQIATLLKA